MCKAYNKANANKARWTAIRAKRKGRRTWYACRVPKTGNHLPDIWMFNSKAERDAWIKDCGSDRRSPYERAESCGFFKARKAINAGAFVFDGSRYNKIKSI